MEEKTSEEVELAFEIILHAGNAKGYVFEALEKLVAKDKLGYEELIEKAGEELVSAHNCQTDYLRQTLADESKNVAMIMIHAQDHIMNCQTVYDLVKGLSGFILKG